MPCSRSSSLPHTVISRPYSLGDLTRALGKIGRRDEVARADRQVADLVDRLAREARQLALALEHADALRILLDDGDGADRVAWLWSTL